MTKKKRDKKSLDYLYGKIKSVEDLIGSTLMVGGRDVYINSIKDEDDMASDSETALATQQSIKKYVDDEIVASGSYNDEAAQDAVGTILTDTSTIDFTYNDATPSISAVVIDGGVDHDSLNNFDANEHVDHTAVSILAGDGMSGGGDISTNRTLNVDILGIEDLTDPGADRILFWDDGAGRTSWLTANDHLSISGTNLNVDDDFVTNTGGDTMEGALTINQTADGVGEGLVVYGYDDESSNYAQMYVTSAGDGIVKTNQDVFIWGGGDAHVVLGDDAGVEKLILQNSSFDVVATWDSLGQILIYPNADNKGIAIYGYDDVSAEYISIFMASTGQAYVTASDDMLMSGDTVWLDPSENAIIRLGDNAGTYKLYVYDSDTSEVFSIDSTGVVNFRDSIALNNNQIYGARLLQFKERSSITAPQAGYGVIWVKDNTPNRPMFVDDTGGNLYIALSDGTTGGSGSAGSGNQYVELDINGTTYKVLHDGTV